MAESKNNIITHGLSGKVGDLIVFRSKGNKTFVSAAPRKSTNEPTEAQKAHQKRFQEATIYAKIAVTDTATKDGYEKVAKSKGIGAYNVAVADFLQAPDIVEINLSRYSGNVGDVITIIVNDDFMTKKVTVDISNADGTTVESGDAIADASGKLWIYTATTANPSLDGDKIAIRAYDLPGNMTEKEREF